MLIHLDTLLCTLSVYYYGPLVITTLDTCVTLTLHYVQCTGGFYAVAGFYAAYTPTHSPSQASHIPYHGIHHAGVDHV